jgi:hypothetical protein
MRNSLVETVMIASMEKQEKTFSMGEQAMIS